MTVADHARRFPRWPLTLIALSAATAIWGGWVSLGALTGFGMVRLDPGIRPAVSVDLALTLPVSVEAYAAYALAAWLGPWQVPARARRFAMCSAGFALLLGLSGQASYHLLAAHHARSAPALVTVLVSSVPVIVIGCAATLTHLLRGSAEPSADVSAQPRQVHPLTAALIARVAPAPPAVSQPPPEPASVPSAPPRRKPSPRRAASTRAEREQQQRDRVRAALTADPKATVRDIAGREGVSEATVARVKKAMREESAGPVRLHSVAGE